MPKETTPYDLIRLSFETDPMIFFQAHVVAIKIIAYIEDPILIKKNVANMKTKMRCPRYLPSYLRARHFEKPVGLIKLKIEAL